MPPRLAVDHIVPVEDMPERLLAHQAELSAAIGWQQAQANREDWREHLKKIANLFGPGSDTTLPTTKRIR